MQHSSKIVPKVLDQQIKTLVADGFLTVLPCANRGTADLRMVGKLLAIPAFDLAVFPEKNSAAPVEKQGVVIQKVFDRDGIEGSQLVRNLRGEAPAEIAAFQIPIEPFFHADHGGNVFLQQTKAVAAPTQTVPWVRDVGVRVVHTVERLRLYGGAGACQSYLQDV